MNNRVVVRLVLAIVSAGAALWAQAQPAAPAAPAEQPASTSPVAKQPRPKSQPEVQALQAIFGAQDVDSRIKAGDEFLTKFADSEFKPFILMILTNLFQQKNDYEKMMIYGERTLEADPQNFTAMLILAQGIAQRTREFDLDKEEKLARVEKLVKSAEELLKTAPRPRPDVTDEQWEAAKKDMAAQGHEALGMSAMTRKKYDVAVAEFKIATATANPEPTALTRLGEAYAGAGQNDNAIATFQRVLAMPNLHPQIKQYVQAKLDIVNKAKAGGAQPAAAPGTTVAPAQVEVKKP